MLENTTVSEGSSGGKVVKWDEWRKDKLLQTTVVRDKRVKDENERVVWKTGGRTWESEVSSACNDLYAWKLTRGVSTEGLVGYDDALLTYTEQFKRMACHKLWGR